MQRLPLGFVRRQINSGAAQQRQRGEHQRGQHPVPSRGSQLACTQARPLRRGRVRKLRQPLAPEGPCSPRGAVMRLESGKSHRGSQDHCERKDLCGQRAVAPCVPRRRCAGAVARATTKPQRAPAAPPQATPRAHAEMPPQPAPGRRKRGMSLRARGAPAGTPPAIGRELSAGVLLFREGNSRAS